MKDEVQNIAVSMAMETAKKQQKGEPVFKIGLFAKNDGGMKYTKTLRRFPPIDIYETGMSLNDYKMMYRPLLRHHGYSVSYNYMKPKDRAWEMINPPLDLNALKKDEKIKNFVLAYDYETYKRMESGKEAFSLEKFVEADPTLRIGPVLESNPPKPIIITDKTRLELLLIYEPYFNSKGLTVWRTNWK